MAEKPILFNTPMVQAILDGRKTQTRRLVKPTYREEEGGFQVCTNMATGQKWVEKMDWDEGSFDPTRYVNPPCQPGDILWVREAWCQLPVTPGGHTRIPGHYYYRADPEMRPEGWRGNWRPSIHMPRNAARIFLQVNAVRVERLQNMKMSDIQAEGVVPFDVIGGQWQQWQHDFVKPVWDSTIKKADIPDYGWDANPWVWVIEFERIDYK